MKKCFLCDREILGDLEDESLRESERPIYKVNCELCGQYGITDVLVKTSMSNEKKEAIAWYIKDNPNYLVNSDNIDIIEQEYKIYNQKV